MLNTPKGRHYAIGISNIRHALLSHGCAPFDSLSEAEGRVVGFSHGNDPIVDSLCGFNRP